MSRYFTQNIDITTLHKLLCTELSGIPGTDCWDEEQFYMLFHKDLSKVEFSTENCSSEEVFDTKYMGTSLIGFHYLDNGLAFLGLNAGGDWEVPIFFIIYWDGKKLRGYIPNKGNPYCHKNKCAWGSEEDVRENGHNYYADHFDFDLIKEDILSRIKFK